MIKLIIFDLDGVLLDKDIHYHSLNAAIDAYFPEGVLTYEEHEQFYNGRPTREKLELLTLYKGLPKNLYNNVWDKKQHETSRMLLELKQDKEKIELLHELSKKYKLAMATNAIKNTAEIALESLGIERFLNPVISNECVRHTKPYPDCYWRCMAAHKALPKETLIIEDSDLGINAARSSGAYVYECIKPEYLDYKRITRYIELANMDIKINEY